MLEAALHADAQKQTARSEESEHLTFTFFEKDHGMELEVVGLTKLRPGASKPECIRGFVNPWGCEIPVIDLRSLYGKGRTRMTSTSCIIIFEHSESYKYYFGVMVEELSNVINIAEGTENRVSPLLLSAKRHLSVNPAIKN